MLSSGLPALLKNIEPHRIPWDHSVFWLTVKTMFIRPYQTQDFAAIAAIYQEAIDRGGITMDTAPYGAKEVEAQVSQFHERETILVLERSQTVIGWGIIKRYSDRPGYRLCCETSTYLSFSEIGKGYGKRLQQSVIRKVKDFGYHHVVAKILAVNQDSIEFHKRFGFRVVGIQKEIGCLQGIWHDVVILQLILAEKPHQSSDGSV